MTFFFGFRRDSFVYLFALSVYFCSVAAENAAFMMDPRFHGMWPPWDEAQWQQFYQMMPAYQQQQLKQQQQQQQQQQQLHERSKQELLFSKQASQFPFSAYPFYYGDKHFDPQRKVLNFKLPSVTKTEFLLTISL